MGLPPGTPVHHPARPATPIRLHRITYGPESLTESTGLPADALPAPEPGGVLWLDLDGVHDVAVMERIGADFGLHPLVLEDLCNTGQRARVDLYDGYLYVVLKMISHDPETSHLRFEQLSLVLGEDYVLTFQERPGDVFEPVRERIRKKKGRIRTEGASYLAYALLDVIVDHYFLVLEAVGDRMETLEEKVLAHPTPHTQKELRDLRREMILLRRAIWPVRDLVNTLGRTESDLISASLAPFLRDLYDHVVQVIDFIESLRDVLSGLADLYLSSLSQRMNEIMKVLTLIGTIFIPLTFIAGIYGMNFDYMPELHLRYGYPLAMAVMAGIALMLVGYFRKKHWL